MIDITPWSLALPSSSDSDLFNPIMRFDWVVWAELLLVFNIWYADGAPSCSVNLTPDKYGNQFEDWI